MSGRSSRQASTIRRLAAHSARTRSGSNGDGCPSGRAGSTAADASAASRSSSAIRASTNSSSRGPVPHAASGPHSTSMRSILSSPGVTGRPGRAPSGPRMGRSGAVFMAEITDQGFLTPAELHVPALRSRRSEGAAPSAPSPCAAREAVVTSQPGVVPDSANPDVVLIGGGIMSATLAALLEVVAPQWSITVFESAAGRRRRELARLEQRRHRPRRPVRAELHARRARRPGGPGQGRHDQRAVPGLPPVLVAPGRAGLTGAPKEFINPVPHVSFVTGEDGRAYMRARHEALAAQPLFDGLEYSDDPAELAEWTPLMMAGRDPRQLVAATRSAAGTDVNFGALTRMLLEDAADRGVAVHCQPARHEPRPARPTAAGRSPCRDTVTGERRTVRRPVRLRRRRRRRAAAAAEGGHPGDRRASAASRSAASSCAPAPPSWSQHQAKVYGQAAVGAPPMSVPHLDPRVIDGDHSLMFGPYAGFSPKFLKAGSMFDLPRSVKPNNLGSMLGVARTELALTRYLVNELLQSGADRHQTLRAFVPDGRRARLGDDHRRPARPGHQAGPGDRPRRAPVRHRGRRRRRRHDRRPARRLPGASTAVSAMLDLLERCFPDRMPAWRPALQEAIPSYGRSLADDPALLAEVRASTMQTLELNG